MVDRAVKVSELVEFFDHIYIINGSKVALNREINVSDLSRPGVELTGYFTYYPHDRVQLFGRTEMAFFEEMTPEERTIILRRMCYPKPPAFLISRDLEIQPEFIEETEKMDIAILGSDKPTTRLSAMVTNFLEERLAERMSQHGVLVDIFGMGCLIIGDSGIGKSETALELIQRGHRLVADDRVDLYMMDESRIIGEAPEILRHLIEIRGIGVINVVNLFGVGSIRQTKVVNLVIELKHWDDQQQYDRLGYNLDSMRFFNVDIPKLSIPVRVGRNLSIIIEIAAMNTRAKQMGYDATVDFENKLAMLIAENSKK